MSTEGGLSNEEYGGAHEKHDTGLDVNNTVASDCNFIKSEDFNDCNSSVQILSFQDGDIISKGIDSDNDNVQSFLSGELDSFQSSTQNVQWLRERNDNVDFEIPSSSEDESDLFQGSVSGLSGTDAGILCSDVSGAQMFISPISQSIFSSADTNLVQSPNDVQQIAPGTQCIQANVVDQFTSSATVSNIELAESVGLGTQATILHNQNDLEDLLPNNGKTQESIPESGTNVTTTSVVKIDNHSGISSSPNGEPTILLAPPANMSPQYIQATTIPQTIQVIPPSSGLPQSNLKFATISISTDKPTNSTHILVNTNQGNQLYKINTEDLQQANANTLSPTPETTSQPNTLQTGYLVLNPDPSNKGMVNVIQMEGGPPKVIQNVLKSVENKKVFVCPVEGCQKMFRRMSKYKTHQMRHTGERPYKCSKPGCEWAFTTHYKLKRHEESHQGKKDFMCPIEGCGGKFTTVYNLNSHIKLHSRPCTEKCPVEGCMEMFATKRQLDVHMRSHTGHEKTFKCPHEGCDKVFASPLSMGSHPRVHLHNKEDLTCKYEGCGKTFDKVCRLNQHMRSHTGEKPYICTFEGCNWAFTTASKLTRHEAKHTGLRKWVCDICGKGFMRSEHLKGHKITHSGDKPFACPIEGCDIKFTAKSSLFVHMKRHENGGKKVTYHCPMEGCLKKYSNKPSLRAHIVKHVKQVMSENNNAQSDGANLDIMPYLDSDLPEIGLLASIDGPNTSEVTDDQPVTTSSETVQSTAISEPANVMIDPSEFIASSGVSEPSFMTSETGEVQQISPEVISQILSSMEKQDQMAATVEPQTTQTKPGKDKGNNKSGGSARTDYHANQLMSERARKRRMKESSIAATESSFQVDVAPKNNFMTDTFPSGDGMTSRGITFRDPETGVLYLQTQLLQDDPPNTELYSDDVEISPDLPVTSCTPLHDSGTEYTGSTINLQDLE